MMQLSAPGVRKALLAFAVVSLLSFLCFLPDLQNGLLQWDDEGYIIDNPYIRTLSLETVQWAFTSFWCNFWAPLTWLSLALDYAVWGLNPFGYHLTNNIFHAINTGMFFMLALQLFSPACTGNSSDEATAAPGEGASALGKAALASLLFALHPLRVESVAWATERKDVLCLFFILPALFAYLRYIRTRTEADVPCDLYAFIRSPYYWLSFALFCLSLLSKPMLVTFAAVLLILDWYPLGRLDRNTVWGIVREKVPFLLVSIPVALTSMAAQRPQMMSLDQSGVGSRLLIAAKAVASYLWMTLWPLDISPFYVHPMNISAPTLDYVLSVVLVGAVSFACLRFVGRYPVLLCVWLLYLVLLFPVLGFTQVGPQAMAARFTYIPSLPVSMMFAAVLFHGVGRFIATPKGVRWAILSAVLLFYAAFAVRDISFWQNDVTLWSRVIDLSPNATGRAYYQRSYAYAEAHQYQHALADVNRALEIAVGKHYRALHEIYPQRAEILAKLGNYSGAIADYGRALETAPVPDQVHFYRRRSDLYLSIGQPALAAADARSAELAAGRN